MAVLVISLVISIFVAAIIFLKTKADKPRGGCNKNVPPSPRGLPLLGHLHLLGSLPHRSLRSVALAHGPVVLLRLGRVRAVVVSSAAAAEEVMKTRDLAFASRPASAMAQRLLYGRDVAFAPYGEYWRQTRRLCVAHLLSARRIQSFRGVREQEAQKLVGRIRRRSKSQQAMDLGELLVAYANGVVSRAAFGDDESWRGAEDDGDDVRKVLSDFQTLIGTEPVGEFLPWLGWVDTVTRTERKIKRTFQALDAVLEKVIDDHRRPGRQIQEEEDDRRDFVDVLLDVNKNEKEYGIRLETNEIKAIILVNKYFFFGFASFFIKLSGV
jgi:cytochrome P450